MFIDLFIDAKAFLTPTLVNRSVSPSVSGTLRFSQEDCENANPLHGMIIKEVDSSNLTRLTHRQTISFASFSLPIQLFVLSVFDKTSFMFLFPRCLYVKMYSIHFVLNPGWVSVKMYFVPALATDVQTLITGWLLSSVHDQIYHQHFVSISSYCYHPTTRLGNSS